MQLQLPIKGLSTFAESFPDGSLHTEGYVRISGLFYDNIGPERQ